MKEGMEQLLAHPESAVKMAEKGIASMLSHPESAVMLAEKLLVGREDCLEDDAICKVLKRFEEDPTKIFFLLLNLYSSWSGAKTSYEERNWLELFATLKLNWWSAFDQLASPAFKNTAEYAAAKNNWEQGFDAMASMAPDAHSRFQAGNKSAWGDVMVLGVSTVRRSMQAGSPANSEAIEKYGNALEGAVKGWSHLQSEKYADAVLAAWTAVNTTIWELATFEETSETGKWVLRLDVVMKGVQKTLADYEANGADSPFCKKKFVTRAAISVSQCYTGFTFDADNLVCLPSRDLGADCSVFCPTNSACPNECPIEKGYCCKKGDENVVPECQRANFVDLSFTKGSPTDYYQCVSPATTVTSLQSLVEEQQQQSLVKRMVAGPMSSLSLSSKAVVRHRHSLESSFGWKISAASVPSDESSSAPVSEWGSHAPLCDPVSPFHESIDGFAGQCFEECPQGYEPSVKGDAENPVQTNECKQMCAAPFANDVTFGVQGLVWEVCSTSKAEADQANTDILTVVKDGFSAGIGAITKLLSGADIAPAELRTYINSISTMGLHFMRPECEF